MKSHSKSITVLVCGGRNFNDKELLYKTLDNLAIEYGHHLIKDEYGNWLPNFRIINGAANGADQLSTEYAMLNWCDFKCYKADWLLFGKAAGFIRNKQMLDKEDVDIVIAFPGGKGTADMIQQARKRGVEVREITF